MSIPPSIEVTTLGMLVAGAVAVLWLLYIYLTWNYGLWKKLGVPYIEPEVPFGTFKDSLLSREFEGVVLMNQYNKFPKEKFVGGFRIRTPYLLLRDMDLIKTVLVKDFDTFQDRPVTLDEERLPLSSHLFNLQGKRWRALRAKLTPAFTSGKMKHMFELMAECSAGLTAHLDNRAARGEVIEMREEVAKFTTDVIGTCAMGMQFNAMEDPDSEFRRIGREVFEASYINVIRRLTVLFLPTLSKAVGLGFESQAVTEFFIRSVREVVEYREKNGVRRGDFIDLLLELKKHGRVEEDAVKEEGDRLLANAVKSNDEINMTDNLFAAQAFVFFLAGFETSSTATSFALYELALNPNIQERLQKEIDQTLTENGGKFTYESIQNMKYLDKVWNESLRKYPPGSDLIRKTNKEYKIPGTNVRLPKNVWIDIPVMAIHHDPKHYPDPERFDPERFSEEEKAKRHNYAFLPFGEGPRICIGMRFGILQGKLALAVLLSKYRFSPSAQTKVPLRLDPKAVVTSSDNGIWLKVQNR